MDTTTARTRMIDRHIRSRGVTDARVLAALEQVPREQFLPPELADAAYEDRPLPIEAGQTISQPYIVALMTEALLLRPDARALEVGTGSGYAAAVLAHVAQEVYTVERHAELAESARHRLADLGFTNVEVRCGDGTLGWPEHAPYDGIVVAAGGPELPPALLDQLAIGGRLVMPVGTSRAQQLIRVTRLSLTEYQREPLGSVRFVPLIGERGWNPPGKSTRRPSGPLVMPASVAHAKQIARLIAECAEPIARIDDAPLDQLIERIGDARVILLGESTHGTSEFYRMRMRITQELIRRCDVRAVAVEADWPDAAVVDRYVRDLPARATTWSPFSRFPRWMWRNRETQALVDWLRVHNDRVHATFPERAVSFSGLDLYSMYTSASEVVRYLDRIDPEAARAARERYGRLTPWQDAPEAYGRAVLLGQTQAFEDEVVAMLRELLAHRLDYAAQGGDTFFDASQNARVVAGAERYYRAMYRGSVESWNLRDQHMFDTMRAILAHRGSDSKIVVWEHNSHIGDASATEMATRGEHNLGQLCRRGFGEDAYSIGFGTDHGTVAAARDWDAPMVEMRVRPARPDSYERLCHDANVPAFLLHLREPSRAELTAELSDARLERAIGVVYRPQSELESHYFQAVLPEQFDEYIWFDETRAVDPLAAHEELAEGIQALAG